MKLNFTEKKLYSGDTWKFTEALSNFSAQDYELQIILKHKSLEPIILKSTPDTTDDTVHSFSKTDTKDFTNGDYRYAIRLLNKTSKEINTIATGVKHIYPDLLKDGADARSYWQKVLDNAKDTLEKLASKEVKEITFQNRTVSFKDIPEIQKLVNYAQLKLNEETGKNTRKVYRMHF
jgi:hypothetical protein